MIEEIPRGGDHMIPAPDADTAASRVWAERWAGLGHIASHDADTDETILAVNRMAMWLNEIKRSPEQAAAPESAADSDVERPDYHWPAHSDDHFIV